jgi:putative hydrolase of the HAD superfamily
MPTMIRTFLFDLGNVLLYFSHERMCAQLGALCGRSAREMRGLLIDSGLHDEYERGRLSETAFQHRLESLLERDLDLASLQRAGGDIFESNPPMLPVLDILRARGHRLVLLSNTSETHINWVRGNFDVLQRFDECVLSFRVGAIKPEVAIYEAALRAIQCEPGECFYTDDIPAYVDRGREFGLQAEVFAGVEDLRTQLQARGIGI